MVRQPPPSHQKIAEKLTILNDRGIGMLTRIYNIKKACSDSKSKPKFLCDKQLEPTIKSIIRRFPNTSELKSNQQQFAPLQAIKTDINKTLSLYYYTFVDLLDYRDHVCELLTTMDACQLSLDIAINFDLTRAYLDLITTYVSLMILPTRVEDRKAVLSLYNLSHDMIHGHSDPAFPRLGQMIIDYEQPMKKLFEEFIPHSKLLSQALLSLHQIFPMRTITAQEWRKSQILSLVANPTQLFNPVQTDTIQCEYLPLDQLEKWITFGFMLTHSSLNQPIAQELFNKSLQCGWCISLFRDEVIHTHSFVQTFFESIKAPNKRISELKEANNIVLQRATNIHRERRKFLRTSLKELCLILADQPGLLGPKILLALMGLAYARDEVNWLLRHAENQPQNKGKIKYQTEDLTDRQLPELLFHMEELRALIRKYYQVIQRYYVQYLSAYDAIALNQIVQTVSMLPEEDSMILETIYTTVSDLNVQQVESKQAFDFRGLRLDWFRLQAYCSVHRYPMHLFEHRDLAILLNMIVFHTRMVDDIDEILKETSNLANFCFFSKIFDSQFHMCLEYPLQTRYIVAFPLICAHFIDCTHELCPEERYHIGDRSLTFVNIFLDEMTKEARTIISLICTEQCMMSDRLLPKHAAPQIAQVVNRRKRDKKSKQVSAELEKPGFESYRRSREDLTDMDKLHLALTELCYAINYCSTIEVWDHTFCPREYLTQRLESYFNKSLVDMVMFNQETNEIAKPSELYSSVKAFMSVLQSIETIVHIDVTRMFNDVLLQQTQPQDSHGEKTITTLYSFWYLEVLLHRVSLGHIVYSPLQRAFVSLTLEGQMPFSAEEYSDINELRALAELIKPYGARYLCENLVLYIVSQVDLLKKLVVQNKETLIALRSNFDKPDHMRELSKRLRNADDVLNRVKIIGVILCFQKLVQDALNDVLERRIPFLLSSIKDFKQQVASIEAYSDIQIDVTKNQIVNEMASATGLPSRIDPALMAALRVHKNDMGEDEYEIACLMMVFIAVSLPRLAKEESSTYRPSLEAHTNNIHCIATAVNTIAPAMFSILNHGDIEDRLKEFLGLASSSLLRLINETDKELIKNRESVYLLIHILVEQSPFLTMDLLESCFPYCLLRHAYQSVYKTRE
uniref:Membrane-associated protein Hem n=1 Tax=Aceria tosichella TaxID=561515 RepID=A0A6G1S5S9_9ACAR